MAGVEATGFVVKSLEELEQDLIDAEQAEINPQVNTSATSVLGQLNGIFAAKLNEVWDVAHSVYSSFDPNQAEGAALTALAALTGTVRRAATKSTVTLTVNLNAGVTLPAGSIASVTDAPTRRFVTLADATNGGGSPANVSVEAEAESTGVVVGSAGTIEEIETPFSGWNTVTNAADADLGQDEETDAELRLRREEDIRRTGSGAPDAIRADVLAVDDVTYCRVFENTTDVTDGDGLPPHSIEVLVLDGADADIAQAIWDSKPAGIATHGTDSDTATDSLGNTHTVEFSRPSEIDIYLDFHITTNADPLLGSIYPGDGDTQVKDAVAVWWQTNKTIGDDVILAQLYPAILEIDGVTDVRFIEADTSPTPSATSNIAIGIRELAVLDTGNMTVDITP
jgi:uncharacterized phage protein gp47/JayE